MDVRQHHVLPLLLIGALAALDLAAAPRTSTWPRVAVGCFVGVALGEVALASAWLVFGRWRFLLRLLGTLAIIGLLSFPLSECTNPFPRQWMSVLGLFAGGVAIPAAILRAVGMHAVLGESAGREAASVRDRRWQFSVAALFVATTALAVLLSAIRLTEFPWEHAVAVLCYCIGFALVALIALTTGWGRRWPAFRIPVCCAIAAGIGLGLGTIEGNTLPFALTTFAEAAVVCAGLAVLRVSGYRMAWIRKSAPN